MTTAATAGAASLTPGEKIKVEKTTWLGPTLGYGEEMPIASAPTHISSPNAGGDILWGTDIGIPVFFPQRSETIFFFGDTDLLDQTAATSGQAKMLIDDGSSNYADYGVFQGDAMALSRDTTPDDGIHLDHVYRNLDNGESVRVCDKVLDNGFRPQFVPGVHPDPCDGKSQLTTPTGAWQMDGVLFMITANHIPIPGTNSSSAYSYLALSIDDGYNWILMNNGQPFSQPSGSNRSKFVHIEAMEVDAATYQDMNKSGPCLLPLPTGADTRGLLLFGAGAWGESDVFLGFLGIDELQMGVDDLTHVLKPWYFAGTDYTAEGKRCWSQDETKAIPILQTRDVSLYETYEAPCGHRPIEGSAGAGYVSVVRLEQTAGVPYDRLLMMVRPAYLTCDGASPDCCGGTLGAGGTTCITNETADTNSFIHESYLGTMVVTGEVYRPWIWNVLETPEQHDGTYTSADLRPFRPAIVPPDPAKNYYGNSPLCTSVLTDQDVLFGYAPLLHKGFTRERTDGTGFDVFFMLSRWFARNTPDDPGPFGSSSYHYMVDTMRTTIVTTAATVPLLGRWPAAVLTLLLLGGAFGALRRRGGF